MIQVLQTYGADLKYNPHIHSIVTEGGFERKKNWIHVDFIRYKGLRKKWQYELLTRFKNIESHSLYTIKNKYVTSVMNCQKIPIK